MAYYTATGNPPAATKDLSALLRNEFLLIQQAFAALGVPGSSALGAPFKWSTSTTMGDPGAGYLRVNNATLASATAAAIDLLNSNGVNVSAMLALMGTSTNPTKALLRLTKLSDTTQWVLYTVSALASPGGYQNPTIAYVSGSATFLADDDIQVEIAIVGNKGDTGPTGSTPLTYTARNSGTNAQLSAANFASATRIALHWTGATAFTQTIIAAATVGAGNWLPFKNDSTATITIDPDAAENITGNGATATTLKIYPGESGILSCDGSAFYVTGLAPKGSHILLTTQTASASATLDFANVFTSDFDEYLIEIINMKPATDNVGLWIRTSSDGGSTYDAGASDYKYTGTTAAQIVLAASVGNDVGEQVCATVRALKPSAAAYFTIFWTGVRVNNTGAIAALSDGAQRVAAADVDSFRLLMSSGNITSGDVHVYGVKK